MVKRIKRCLQFSLKLVNATIAIVGIAMMLYGVWMIRIWQRDTEGSSDDYIFALPWFIHAFLGLGIALCGITCLGHFAADSANHFCLASYSIIIFLLIIVDTAMISDVFLNSDWEKDIPEDPSGRFEDFKDFVKSNIDACKWIALFIILSQGCSIILATILRTLGPEDDDLSVDSDEEYYQPRIGLLNPPVGEPLVLDNTDFWNPKRMRENYAYP